MPPFPPVTAVGLMSGTSLDGVDAALVRTDGEGALERGPALTLPYPDEVRERVRGLLGRRDTEAPEIRDAARALTGVHVEAVRALLGRSGTAAGSVRVVGFHGHTLLHQPVAHVTVQIGDGDLLAREVGIEVVDDFRTADVAAGGQGAPLVPLYHAALARGLDRPVAVLNVGGVANVTWVGTNGLNTLLAFDTGPGNALIDDWVRAHAGRLHDENGGLAARGKVDGRRLAALLEAEFFGQRAPKSLDRDDFKAFAAGVVHGLSLEDGAATLTAFTAKAAARAAEQFPAAVERWLVAGGGRRNASMMKALRCAIGAPVDPVEAVGWDGDALEAQAFAYLAVRSLRGLPLTLPSTTGCGAPTTGGRRHLPPG